MSKSKQKKSKTDREKVKELCVLRDELQKELKQVTKEIRDLRTKILKQLPYGSHVLFDGEVCEVTGVITNLTSTNVTLVSLDQDKGYIGYIVSPENVELIDNKDNNLFNANK